MGTITARGPVGRHALAFSVIALGLAALTGCTPPAPSYPHAHQKASAATAASHSPAPATPAASSSLQPVTGTAVPGRSGRYGSAPLGVLSATFISARTGWALGVLPCARHRCRLQLRKTTDHGRHWFTVPAPPAPYAAAGGSPVPGAVASIRFADTTDGWAFGPGLWATHDGGRTWHRLSLGGWPVQSLEAGGGRVIAVATACLRCGRFRVYTSPVTRDRWRRVPGGYGTGGTAAAQTGPAVTVAAGTGLVTVPAPLGPRQPGRPSLLTGPADGSARWHRLSTPCAKWAWNAHAAATPGLALLLGCAGQPGAGNQMKNVYFSPGQGGTWQPLARLPSGGYLGAVSISPAGTIVLSGYLIPVDVSWDGGRTWHGTASTSPSMERAYAGGESLVAAMTTDTQGFTLEFGTSTGKIWFTYDGAHTWQLITLH
jgi:hypothetical protein